MPIVDQRVQVAAVYGERNVDADVACGFSYGACFCWKVSKALHARVVRHHRADAPTRGAAEGDRGCKPGIDRGNEREIGKPGLERHVVAADLAQSDNARMIVRIGERRQNEGSGSGAVVRPDGGDSAGLEFDDLPRLRRLVRTGQEPRRREAPRRLG